MSENQTAGLTFFAFDLLDVKDQDLRSQPLRNASSGSPGCSKKLDSSHHPLLEHFEAGAERC